MAQILGFAAPLLPFPYNIAAAVGSALLTPQEVREGPRLEEAPTNPASNGAPLPILIGNGKLEGRPVEAGALREESDTQSAGKGSLFGGPKVKTYSYYRTILYLCGDAAGDHPIDGVQQIYLGGQLEVDLRPENDGPVTNGHSYRVLFGDEDQLADEELIAELGEGKVPAYRGVWGVIFYDLDVTPYGGAIPPCHVVALSNATPSYPKFPVTEPSGVVTLRSFTPDLFRPYVLASGLTAAAGERLAKYDKHSGALLQSANVATDYSPTSSGAQQDCIVLANGDPVLVGTKPPFVEGVVIRLDADSLAEVGRVGSGTSQPSERSLAVQQIPPLPAAPQPIGWHGVFFEGRFSGYTGKVSYLYFPFNGAPLRLGGGTLDNEGIGAIDLAGKVWIPSQGTLTEYLFSIGDGGQFNAVAGATYDYSGDFSACRNITYWPQTNSLALLGSNGKVIVYDIDEAAVVETHQLPAAAVDGNNADWMNWRTTPWVSSRFQGYNGGYALNLLSGEIVSFANSDYGVIASGASDWNNVLFEPETETLWCARESAPNPSQRFRRPRLAGDAVTLKTALDRISEIVFESSGDYDFTAQTQELFGFQVTQPMKAYEAMAPLLAAFGCDVVEIDGTMTGVNRGGALARTLELDDLGASASNDFPEILDFDEIDPDSLPKRMEARFIHAERDYEYGLVPFQITPEEAPSKSAEQYDWPIGFADDETPRTLVLRKLIETRTNARRGKWSTMTCHAALIASDVVAVPDAAGALHRLRIDRIERGMNDVIRMEGVKDLAEVYSLSAEGTVEQANVFTGQALKYRPAVRLLLLDIPLLRPQDDGQIGPYAAVWRRSSAGSFGGAAIQKSPDGGGDTWIEVGTIAGEAAGGFASTALGDTDRPYVFDDDNTLDVTVENGLALENKSDSELLGQWANLIALVPKANSDRAELVQFGTATQLADYTWRLSHLLRGRLGTEQNTGLHAAGDLWVMLTDRNVAPLSQPLAEAGAATLWRAVALGQSVPEFEEIAFTNTGKRLWPYAPYDLAGVRDGSNNLTVSFETRSRTTPAPFLNHPVGEDSESYVMEILGGSPETVLRTVTGSSTSLGYTAAQQTADGLTPGDPVKVRVSQVNATLAGIAGQDGRGYGATATV